MELSKDALETELKKGEDVMTATRLWEMSEKIERLSDEIERLKAENERLREALERIANAAEDAAVWWLQDLARAALVEEK